MLHAALPIHTLRNQRTAVDLLSPRNQHTITTLIAAHAYIALLAHALGELGHMALGISAAVSKVLRTNTEKSSRDRQLLINLLTAGLRGTHLARLPYGGMVEACSRSLA